ncbi:3'(2'), 5'-bisphosphate nucleotidase [Parabacteroides sp. PF5-5]|uniref:3'(2'),5'-bisphosphate nucleotidase CysQ n=1 Tax=unclassified Parabacteroides TaxID=2649774 RepID=UPI002476B43C|nr:MULTISPECIES: 3'(2'),5'-bisphosphate nucleotidase CysQ [unclassified Parabacteroides]MDH6304348.1 3'(2'), 5'-bisphosphate nucleotidase [Parabacteroides sp. PH5-39]MDH6315499.1 3'(2'), 5'-bisphosphate nucleotidase [Parabacteroides sp. PF5-13]MDH6319007.1 3'(2'), 5'-bisphosphate nucleotidase [Parabacteroides sp. PH5-13]MDH6322736.1 3'(2'), 5'-bisphosphate nucleotidase [Parabacteroides sp. PH5-8]MDH6326692.1 3'(2'), 5'-bisphosphate nucleotidase [Parabacteroides sp. PH5-41]
MTNISYLYIAIRAAVDAGRSIMDIYTNPEEALDIEQKADHSPVTRADKVAHHLITNVLSATPYPILSEEGKNIPYAEREKWETFWMVDPLDGTKEFIKHNGEFTVNIALIHNRVPVLGVIYVPVRKELYFAEESIGAYKLAGIDYTNQPSFEEMKTDAIRLPLSYGHQGLVVVSSRSHQSEKTIEFIDNLRKQGQPVTTINSGSSLKICLVAEGTADIYPRFAPTMEWDTAAGHAIAKAAGCEIYHADEKTPLRYNKENLTNQWFIVKPISPKC